MDHNLRYALLEDLANQKIFQFDKKTFFKEQLKKEYDPCASYNYQPCEPIEVYFQSIDLLSQPLENIDALDWSASSNVIHYIWQQWDGEDEYVDLESLEGIEICPNIKSITVEYLWRVTNLSPLSKLKKIESIVIWSPPADPIESLSPLLKIENLKDICFEGVRFENHEETEQVIEQLKEKGVQVDIIMNED